MPSPRARTGLRAAAGAVVVISAAAVAAGLLLRQSASGSGRSSLPASLPLAPISSLRGFLPAPSPGPLGSEGVPVPAGRPLARAGAPAPGSTVDGISGAVGEQLAFHIHAYLTVFVAGSPRQIPYGIGIAPPIEVEPTPRGPFAGGGAAFFWLHTHAADGIIHIESPIVRTYTLGDFFDIWHEPLSAEQLGPARGKVTAFFDGRRYLGSPRGIPLLAHAQIQLDAGRPLVAPETIDFPAGL